MQITFPLVKMFRKMYYSIHKCSFRITLQKMTHFAFSAQNFIYYFRLTAVLIVVTKSFLGEIIIIKYGSHLERIQISAGYYRTCFYYMALAPGDLLLWMIGMYTFSDREGTDYSKKTLLGRK